MGVGARPFLCLTQQSRWRDTSGSALSNESPDLCEGGWGSTTSDGWGLGLRCGRHRTRSLWRGRWQRQPMFGIRTQMLLNTSVQKRAITSAKYGRSARCAQAVLSGVVFLMTGSHWRPLLRQLFANSSIVASREGGAIGSSRASAGKLSHQTVAEALHIELALMATTVGGFGQLPAHYSPAHLRPRRHVLGCCGRLRPLRSLRRRR
jgi:hypothetical protein